MCQFSGGGTDWHLACSMIYWGFSCTNTSKIKRDNIFPNGNQFLGQKVYSEVKMSSEYCP